MSSLYATVAVSHYVTAQCALGPGGGVATAIRAFEVGVCRIEDLSKEDS